MPWKRQQDGSYEAGLYKITPKIVNRPGEPTSRTYTKREKVWDVSEGTRSWNGREKVWEVRETTRRWVGRADTLREAKVLAEQFAMRVAK